MQAVGQRVEVGEAGRHAGHLPGLAGGDLDLVHRRFEQLAQPQVVVATAGVDDAVDLGLRGVDDVLDGAALGVPHLDDPGARLDKPAQHRALGDDLGVVAGVRRGGDGGDELVEVRLAADAGQLAALGQLVGDGDGVGRLAAPVQLEDRVIDELVRGPVEVLAAGDLEAVGDGVLGQQHPAEDGLLGMDVLRGSRSSGARRRGNSSCTVML